MVVTKATRRMVRHLALTATAGLSVVGFDRASAQSQAEHNIEFHLAAGDLDHALTQAADQSGMHIFFPSAAVAGKKTPGLSGRLTLSQVMGQLLEGRGLTWRLQDARTIIVSLANNSATIMLGPVRVAGTMSEARSPSTAVLGNLSTTYPGGQVARGGQLGMLGNHDVMDTPFNQTSYTAKFIQDRQIRNIRDALKDDPSVRGSWGTGSAGQEQFQVRGFNVGNGSTSYGGMYGMLSSTSIMSELAERVEVLRGPSALLNGMSPDGAIGGAVNVVPKRAHDTPITEVGTDYTSDLQFGGHADVGRRFGRQKQLGVRLNGVIRSGPTAIEHNALKTALTSASVDLRLRHVRLATDFGYQHREITGVIPYLALASGVPVPDASHVRRNIDDSWSYLKTEDIFGVFRGEADLFRNVTAYGSVGVHQTHFEGIYPASITVSDRQGNGSTSLPIVNTADYRTITADLGMRADLKTGPVRQVLAFSANRLDQTTNQSYAYAASRSVVNIYNETSIPAPTLSVPHHLPKASGSTLSSLAFADTLSALEKRIQITAGLRVQRVQSTNYNTTTGIVTSSYDRTAISPAVMAVFKPLKNVSVYGNWIQGIQQGTTVGSTYANAGEVFAPYKSTQYEVGIKADIKKFIVTFDVFQITQPSTVYNLTSNVMSLNGQQRNRGLELNIAGEIVHGLRTVGGLMLIDPVLKKTQGGLYDGQRAPNVSPVNFNMGLDYSLPLVKELAVTADVIYTSSQYIENPAPRRSIPGWTRLDVGVRYAIRNPASEKGKITLYLNVDNVAGARYWNSGGYNNLTLSAPRTFRIAAMANF
ncbi:TonB-dependent receptor [Acetobacter suratthaniensis]|uniref:TonB-dependent receptor n=2 Tax=Acetobacter suratthaniensis TaxID=1502841 RepID=A0ABS3LNW0_9PROT|nr:TonB-dependent receptor [Acetobacter suratthaniensis]